MLNSPEPRFRLRREPGYYFEESWDTIGMQVQLREFCVNLMTLTVVNVTDTRNPIETPANEWIKENPVPRCTRRYEGKVMIFHQPGFTGDPQAFWDAYDGEASAQHVKHFQKGAYRRPRTILND